MAEYFTKEGDDYKKVDSELFTQEGVDKIVKDRAERVARSQFGDYDELKEKAGKVDSIRTEFETKLAETTTKVETLTKERDSAKLEVDKVKIVNEFKLPEDLHDFVTGADAAEMRKRAEKLSKGVKLDKIDIDKKPKPDEGKATDSKKIAGTLFGKKSDD